VSAVTGEGREELISAMEAQLALDTARVTLEFSTGDDQTHGRIAQLYRIGRILRHVTTDGRVSIEAELPRRLVDRFRDAAVELS
jgi:50S ribosomal subunit-associated GTPase HflX